MAASLAQPAMREITAASGSTRSVSGKTLAELSQDRPLLLLFLRHAGCGFCREALGDLKRYRAEIETAGASIAVVHMSPADEFGELLAAYQLADLEQFSDPQRRLFAAFGVGRGSLWQILNPRVFWRGIQAVIFQRHGCGRIVGDVYQMPGLFVIFRGRVLAEFRHRDAADRPNYLQLVKTAVESLPSAAEG